MKPRKKVFYVGGAYVVVTFLLFYVGVAVVLDQPVLPENLLAFGLFALLVGLISGIFAFIKNNYGLIIFSVGYVIAFGFMYYTFLSDMTGWEGLIGLIQMMMILGISIAVAIVAEVIVFFMNKNKEKQHHL